MSASRWNRPWTAAVLHWARDGRRNRSGMPGPALAESPDGWAVRESAGTLRLVTDGIDATRFPGSAQYEAHQRAGAEHLHTALAEAVQELAEAWDDLNALGWTGTSGPYDLPCTTRPYAPRISPSARPPPGR
ncbi:hypothetical protein [Streptomyces exfoliatus]|uniref:hypothetical protein n=1 Tax=Streptomyces exfoliatus TaxID=1905 RepID=UPI003C2E703D